MILLREQGKLYSMILSAIRQSLRASGYRSRTKEEIDAQILAEREGWEE
jgi:hypothetical protein